jgi:putative PIN family toxin of toxin-antitoxin system
MTAAKPNLIVVDTCVAISAAILPRSQSARAFSLALSHFQIVASESTLNELVTVIYRSKFNSYLTDEARIEFLTLVAQASKVISVKSVITDCVDPKDNQFLALAIDSGAKTILSSDPHLTDMNPYKGIEIIMPTKFLEQFSDSI